MAITPMEQFEVKPLIPIHVGGYDISFTNQALWMVIAVASITLFLTFAVSQRRLVPTRMQSLAEMSYEFVAGMINMTAAPGPNVSSKSAACASPAPAPGTSP